MAAHHSCSAPWKRPAPHSRLKEDHLQTSRGAAGEAGVGGGSNCPAANIGHMEELTAILSPKRPGRTPGLLQVLSVSLEGACAQQSVS